MIGRVTLDLLDGHIGLRELVLTELGLPQGELVLLGGNHELLGKLSDL